VSRVPDGSGHGPARKLNSGCRTAAQRSPQNRWRATVCQLNVAVDAVADAAVFFGSGHGPARYLNAGFRTAAQRLPHNRWRALACQLNVAVDANPAAASWCSIAAQKRDCFMGPSPTIAGVLLSVSSTSPSLPSPSQPCVTRVPDGSGHGPARKLNAGCRTAAQRSPQNRWRATVCQLNVAVDAVADAAVFFGSGHGPARKLNAGFRTAAQRLPHNRWRALVCQLNVAVDAVAVAAVLLMEAGMDLRAS
jgi:hypothetical protein